MVKKFEEYIKESLWKKGIERSKTGEIRHEEGKKVKTSIGVDMVLENSSCDYEWLIQEFLNHINNPYDINITFLDNSPFVKNNMEETDFVINDKLIALFPLYSKMIDDYVFDEDDYSEHDYLSIIEGITKRLKEVDIIERVHDRKKGRVSYDIFIPLLTEEQVQTIHKQSDEKGEYWDSTFLEKFQNSLIDEFNNEINIYLEEGIVELKLNYDSLSKYNEILTYTKDYFYDELGNW